MTPLQPHQQRVLDEKAALDAKMVQLAAFIASSPIYLTLEQAEQVRLARQYSYMKAYSDVLGERINAFTLEPH